MDELEAKLQAIAAGELRNADQIRPILAEANRLYEEERNSNNEFQSLWWSADRAFVEGWPAK